MIDEKSSQLTKQALSVYEDLHNYSIATPDKYELASIDLKKAKEILKALDSKEKDITRPINDGLKRARDFFRPAKNKITIVINKISLEMSTFRRKQEAEAKKQREELEAEAGKEDAFVPEVKPEIPKTGVRIRKNWRFEVVDASKLDPKYLIPNERVIGDLVRKLAGLAGDVVGKGSIKVWCEETTY